MDFLYLILPYVLIAACTGLACRIARILRDTVQTEGRFWGISWKGYRSLMLEVPVAFLWLLGVVFAVEGKTIVLVGIHPGEILTVSDAASSTIPYHIWWIVAVGFTLSYLADLAFGVFWLVRLVRSGLAAQRAE